MAAKKGCIPWNKGKKNSQIPWNKGKKGTASKASIDNLKKMANDRKGKSRPPFSKKHRENLSEAHSGRHTFGEWETLKAQYNWTCPCCRKSEPDVKLTEDHIIPISKGGSDNIENIQPLCKSCNCKKFTKIKKYERL